MTMKHTLAWAAATMLGAISAAAQGWQSTTAQAPPAPASASPKAKAAPPAKAAPVQQPLQAQIQYLVRTTLLALNDANRTGNYTVLRDLSAPSLRERNSAADLAQVFAEMRRARLDLSMAALLMAELDEQPVLDTERRLRLKGSFATEPNRVVFDVVYEAVGGQWQLHGIAISTRPSRTAAGGGVPAAR